MPPNFKLSFVPNFPKPVLPLGCPCVWRSCCSVYHIGRVKGVRRGKSLGAREGEREEERGGGHGRKEGSLGRLG